MKVKLLPGSPASAPSAPHQPRIGPHLRPRVTTHHAPPGPRQPDHYSPSASTFPTPPHPRRGPPWPSNVPPQQAPHPPAGCPAWAQLARRPASRAADARWVARRSAPASPQLALATCRPQRLVCRQQGQGLFAALGCSSATPRHPLPPCAQLTGGTWAAGGSGRRSRPPDRPAAGRAGRGLPAPGPAGAFGPPQPQLLFCASSSRSVAALHWFSSVCRACGCSGSIRRDRIRVGVRRMGWRSTGTELRSSRGGQPCGLPARVGWGPCHHVQGPALVAAALRGMRGRGGARAGPAYGN